LRLGRLLLVLWIIVSPATETAAGRRVMTHHDSSEAIKIQTESRKILYLFFFVVFLDVAFLAPPFLPGLPPGL
jgi:hypothetical protein